MTGSIYWRNIWDRCQPKDTTETSIIAGLLLLIKKAPGFAFKIVNEYIYAYSSGLIDNIAPLDIEKLRELFQNRHQLKRNLLKHLLEWKIVKEK